jgi:hypothetical protein
MGCRVAACGACHADHPTWTGRTASRTSWSETPANRSSSLSKKLSSSSTVLARHATTPSRCWRTSGRTRSTWKKKCVRWMSMQPAGVAGRRPRGSVSPASRNPPAQLTVVAIRVVQPRSSTHEHATAPMDMRPPGARAGHRKPASPRHVPRRDPPAAGVGRIDRLVSSRNGHRAAGAPRAPAPASTVPPTTASRSTRRRQDTMSGSLRSELLGESTTLRGEG